MNNESSGEKRKGITEKTLFVFDLFDHLNELDVDTIEIHQQYADGRFLRLMEMPVENTSIFNKERTRYPLFKIVLRGHFSQANDAPPVG